MRDSLRRINKAIPDDAIDEAVKRVLRAESQDLVGNNQGFHRLVANGVPVQFKRPDGTIKDELVWLFDFNDVNNNRP